jgi:hypothetical protein
MLRTGRTLGALATAGAAAALLAACGSSSYSGPNLAKGLTPAQLQSKSQAQVLTLTSFVLGINGTAAIAAVPKALGNSALAPVLSGTPLPIAGSGPVIAPEQFSLAMSLSVAGTTTPVTLVQTGGHLYAVALGRNILLPEAHASTDLSSVVVGMIHAMNAPTLGATTTIDGIPSEELSGALDGALAAKMLGPLLAQLPGASVASATPAQRLAAQTALARQLGQGTVHEWVRVSDLRPARVEVIANIANGAAISPALEHASLDMTVGLSAFDAPQTIAAPANAVPMTTTQLKALLGAG